MHKKQKDHLGDFSNNPLEHNAVKAKPDDQQGAGGGASNEAVNSPIDQMAEKNAEIAKLKDSLLRTIAENENFQKRAQREKDELTKYSLSKFARDLLPVLDNFNRAIKAISSDKGHEDQGLLEGIKMTEKELMAVLERYGVKPIDAGIGGIFDPKYHQAMVKVESNDHKPGCIAEVFQTGYVIYDRLLRPALVSVVKASSPEAENSN